MRPASCLSGERSVFCQSAHEGPLQLPVQPQHPAPAWAQLRADVSYLGSISRKLSDLIDTNPFILDQNVNRVLWTQPGATSHDWSYTPTFANVGHANYNGFQAS